MNRFGILMGLCVVIAVCSSAHGAEKAIEPKEKIVLFDGKTISVYVNGLLQNQGADSNPSSGPICLQSEGSPIEFRNIYLEPIPKK